MKDMKGTAKSFIFIGFSLIHHLGPRGPRDPSLRMQKYHDVKLSACRISKIGNFLRYGLIPTWGWVQILGTQPKKWPGCDFQNVDVGNRPEKMQQGQIRALGLFHFSRIISWIGHHEFLTGKYWRYLEIENPVTDKISHVHFLSSISRLGFLQIILRLFQFVFDF